MGGSECPNAPHRKLVEPQSDLLVPSCFIPTWEASYGKALIQIPAFIPTTAFMESYLVLTSMLTFFRGRPDKLGAVLCSGSSGLWGREHSSRGLREEQIKYHPYRFGNLPVGGGDF